MTDGAEIQIVEALEAMRAELAGLRGEVARLAVGRSVGERPGEFNETDRLRETGLFSMRRVIETHGAIAILEHLVASLDNAELRNRVGDLTVQ